jgi:hypothetical protein
MHPSRLPRSRSGVGSPPTNPIDPARPPEVRQRSWPAATRPYRTRKPTGLIALVDHPCSRLVRCASQERNPRMASNARTSSYEGRSSRTRNWQSKLAMHRTRPSDPGHIEYPYVTAAQLIDINPKQRRHVGRRLSTSLDVSQHSSRFPGRGMGEQSPCHGQAEIPNVIRPPTISRLPGPVLLRVCAA